MTPHIAIIDLSGNIPFTQLQAVTAAVQKQIDLHASPNWLDVENKPLSANLVVYRSMAEVPNGAWPVTIENNIEPTSQTATTQLASMSKFYSATLYGYHLVNNGTPYARLLYTSSYSKVLSHELLEMLVNPFLDRYIGIEIYSETPGEEKVIQEIADPVQTTTYQIDGIEVSNFIFPAWYHVTKISGEKYDYLGLITEPKGILDGGYKSFLSRTGEWWQTFKTDNVLLYNKLGTERAFTKAEIYRMLGFTLGGLLVFVGIKKLIDKYSK